MKTIKKITIVCSALILLMAAGLTGTRSAHASEPFIAQVKAFGFNFAPRGWAFCDGQLLPIAQNTALFSLIGTIYGGDGRSTTALPNLQGRFVMHQGRGPGLTVRRLGERGGSETVTLTIAQMPSHTHSLMADQDRGNTDAPGATSSLAMHPRNNQYSTTAPDVSMRTEAVGLTGGGQPHNNMPPYQVVNFCIALQGLYPSRS
jgi:microcystin-dependent protein